MKYKNYGYIDILKFIFSICIIGIHTNAVSDFNANINWYITHSIFRLAVPFFFVTSGFFYTRKFFEDKQEIDSYTKNYIKRLVYPFIFWLCIGLLINEFKNTYNKNLLFTIILLIKKILFYPWGALWYILALMVSIFILSKFNKIEKYIEPIIISSILYLFALVSNSYYFIIINNCLIKKIVDTYMKIFISSRNGIFVGLLFVSLGGYLYKLKKENRLLKIKTNILCLIEFYIVLIIEITIVKNNYYIDDNSLFLTLPIISFLIVSIFVLLNTKKDYKLLRKYSICMYLVHRPIISIVSSFFYLSNCLICFLFVFSLSLLVSIILEKSNNKYIKLITMI